MSSSAEQEEKLVEFLAVAGDMVDAELARTMLESADWDVELVLNTLLEDGPPPAAVPEVHATEPCGSAQVQTDSKGLEGFSIAELRALLDAHEVDHSTCLEKADLVRMLEEAIEVGDTPLPSARSPSMSQLFGMPGAPSFGSGSRSAHDNELLQWAMNVAMSDGSGPFDCPPCPCQPSPEEQERLEQEKATQALINAERQAEIDIQNAEYQEALLMDQQKEEKRKADEEEERKLQEATARSTQEAEEALEMKRLRVSQPEPDKTNPDRCQIVIRTPCGKRLSRTFLGSDEVSFLYDWIDVACLDQPFVQEGYQLVSRLPGRPSKDLGKSSETLSEEGVEHQTMFFVTSCK